MKILITGAAGFVGCRLTRFLGLSHEVIAMSSKDLDVTDGEQVMSVFMEHMPKAVVHLAALANTKYCEEHPEDSAVVNVAGAVNVARAAAAIGAKLVYASSEQVYNGVDAEVPNVEEQELAPRSVYGHHKLQAELDVQDLLPSAVGLRLTWMYDIPGSPLPQKSGLLIGLISTAREGGVVRASTAERRGVTNVWEVVRRIEAAFALPGGVYNFGSTTDLSSFDLQLAAAQSLFDKGWLDVQPSDLVLPDESWTRNLSLDLSRLQKFGITFPSSLTGLHNAVVHLRKYSE